MYDVRERIVGLVLRPVFCGVGFASQRPDFYAARLS